MLRTLVVLSPGITRGQARHALDSMGFHYSEDSTKRTLTAFRRVDSTSIVYAGLQLHLDFSPDGTLARRTARWVYTGP